MNKPKGRRSRPSWDEYFMEMAKLVAKRSTCLRRSVGAVLVKDKRILATGYNGAPRGLKHCEEQGCLRDALKIPSGERHELCLPAGEEVLTSDGYLPIEEINVGKRVLTHRGIYRRVTRVYKRPYEGQVCIVDPRYLLPVALTPEHPVLAMRSQLCSNDNRTLCKESCSSVNRENCNKPFSSYKPEWVPASQLKSKDILLFPYERRSESAEYLDLSLAMDLPENYYRVIEERTRGSSYQQIREKLGIWPSTAYNWVTGGLPRDCIGLLDSETLVHGSSPAKAVPANAELTPSLLRLIGFYLAEGSSSKNQLCFSFHRKETAYAQEIKLTMKESFGLDCYERVRDNVRVLVYSSVVLAKAFKMFFGKDAYSKRLPRFLTMIEPGQQRFILEAYTQGDGHRIDKHSYTITTASKILALQVVQILLRLGFLPVIDTWKNCYRVTWKEARKLAYGYLKEGVFFIPVRSVMNRHYSGYVYNLEVEEDESYVTKSFAVHNCRALHAEQNALIQASLYGISTRDATVYATCQPCVICAKMLINAGVKEIVILAGYPDKMALEFLKAAKIKVRNIDEPKS